MKDRILSIAVLLLAGVAILAMPAARSPKPTPRQLVRIDDKSMTQIRDAVLKGSDSDLKSLIKNAIGFFWKEYIQRNTYPVAENDLAVSLDSISALRAEIGKQDNIINGLIITVGNLQTTVGSLEQEIRDDSLEVNGKTALKLEIEELEKRNEALEVQKKEITREITALNDEKKSISESADFRRINKKREDLLKGISSDIAYLDKLFGKAKSGRLDAYDSSDYSQARPRYEAIHPLLVIIDNGKDAEFASNLDSLDLFSKLHDQISDVRDYLSGPYDNNTRKDLFYKLNDMQDRRRVTLNPHHKEECVSYLKALVYQEQFRGALLYELFSPLYKQNGIKTDAQMDSWINKFSDYRKEIESDPEKKAGWNLCPTMEKALSDLESFFKYEKPGVVPDAVSDGTKCRARLSEIWKQVDNTPLR